MIWFVNLHALLVWVTVFVLPFLVILAAVVFVHEWGHFFTARLLKIRVSAFSIGFGPKIFGRRDRHGTLWRIGLLPLGGYVSFADTDSTRSLEKFFSYAWYKRFLVSLAGPLANFILSIMILFLLFGLVGRPSLGTIVGSVHADGPLAQAGIHVGDKITAVDGVQIETASQLLYRLKRSEGSTLMLEVVRKGNILNKSVPFKSHVLRSQKGADANVLKDFGFNIETNHWMANLVYEPMSFSQAFVGATMTTWHMITSTTQYLVSLVVGHAKFDQLSGPIGIARYSGEAARAGVASFFFFMAIISTGVGFVNLLPLPILDGGQALFSLIEGARRQPLSLRVREIWVQLSVGLLFVLFLLVTWSDLSHFSFFKKLFGV